jgi:hypothetical protein
MLAARPELAHLDIAKWTAFVRRRARFASDPIGPGAGSGASSTLAALGCRSTLRRSFQGSVLIARTGAGSGCGARTAFGRPRGCFTIRAARSSAVWLFRVRPGLRLASTALGVSVSGTSAAG